MGLSHLAPAWAAPWPCSRQAGSLLVGPLTLPRGLHFPADPGACLTALGFAAACCCRGAESAEIIEDDIPVSPGIPLPAQPLPARDQRLLKTMNPAAHTRWHPPLARLRKEWGAELALQLKTIERAEGALAWSCTIIPGKERNIIIIYNYIDYWGTKKAIRENIALYTPKMRSPICSL